MEPIFVDTNGIKLATYQKGSGQTVVLLHGFPATSVSLIRQFDALADAGYRVIAIDQRGFGKSDFPDDVDAYAMTELTKDIAGVISQLDSGPAYVMGHDWGGAVAWRLALDYPQQVKGVVSLGTFLIPDSDKEPIASRRAQMGEDNYVVAFQKPGIENILDKDVPRSIDFMYRKGHMTVERYPAASSVVKNFELIKEMQAGGWETDIALNAEERAAHIAAFERTGFGPGINWYKNATRNWKDRKTQAAIVQQPSLLISGKDDYFSPPAYAALSDSVVSNLTKKIVPGGHWYPLEYPNETNAIILEWLKAQE